MYIAFKWLLGLCLALWIAMCCVDVIVKKSKDFRCTGFPMKHIEFLFKNISSSIEPKPHVQKQTFKFVIYDKQHGMALLHSFMFVAGALAVSVFNKKKEIILFTKRKFSNLNIGPVISRIRFHLNKTALIMSVATLKYSTILREIFMRLIAKLRYKINVIGEANSHPKSNLKLHKTIREIGEERKTLGQLLIAAIHENKNIRMQYELETMAKSRLERHIEDTQQQIKENRSRYVSFQQLYLVTHQENIFLRGRIKKLTKEKENAEKSLMDLMNEVYKSKNNELKDYCSRFIVQAKNNLLHSDVKAEIDKFLEKYRTRNFATSTSFWKLSEQPNIAMNTAPTWPKYTSTCNTQVVHEDGNLVPLVSGAPKLKGLPGEYVWTVKDKDGIIEKLYEYDFSSDFDNGDTIRRIRQYSVYFDKDCLLDFSNSRTIIINADKSNSARECLNVEYPVTSGKFLTGSEAFQNFLQSNKNMVSLSKPLAPSFH